jgi:D-3-phosphoglycerate dehydrogenase
MTKGSLHILYKRFAEDADAIIPEGTEINDSLLENAKQLKLIQTGADYDNIEINACSKRGIHVTKAAGINARAVAEHVTAFILCWYKTSSP